MTSCNQIPAQGKMSVIRIFQQIGGERLSGPRIGVRLAQLQQFPFFHQGVWQHS
jgi:hypothetical protein